MDLKVFTFFLEFLNILYSVIRPSVDNYFLDNFTPKKYLDGKFCRDNCILFY